MTADRQHRLVGETPAGCRCLLLAALFSASLWGQDGASLPPVPRDNPERMVREATSRLLETAREARAYASKDHERYYAAVTEVLDPVLDMRYFARGVMATYASARSYNALETDAEKAVFRNRVERFVDKSRRVFLVKYADAILTFEGERIDLATLPAIDDDPDHVSLLQTIYDRDGQTYRVQYSLHRDKGGGWLVANVIVEGVNLGQIYRNQFAEAVENHGGDVDYVVDHWVELMMRPEAADKDGSH